MIHLPSIGRDGDDGGIKWRENQFACRCRAEFADLKRACATDYERVWREESCTCECKARICVSGHYQVRSTASVQCHFRD